jgi:ADP-heptose:LPS heptosyltransferase
VAEVERRIGDGVVNLAGETDLRMLTAVIAEMDVVVCPDSGPSHIAAALGVPAVSIFAMKCDLPDRWRPYEDAHRVVRVRDFACAKKRCVREECDYYECLNAIDAGEVVRAVGELTACGVR